MMTLWIRLEDGVRAYQYTIPDENMTFNLDDLAIELCKKEPLATL